ncbi:MAG: hypothetical protein V4643_10675 [Bacteroidota bacterium]
MKNLIIAVILFISFGCNEPSKTPTNEIKNILNADNLPLQTFEINTSSDTIIKGKGGTLITIPKNSFADKNGNPVNGNIMFELKEVLTPLDMVLGNFTTTSDGNILQTGGMIYTNAKTNNENIFLANNKTLTVHVPTKNRRDSMLIFSGETNPKTQIINWVKPEDIIENIPSSRIKENIVVIQPLIAPVKPIKVDKVNDRLLSIKFENSQMFPELKQYRNFKFRVSEKSNFDLEDGKKTWFDVKLARTEIEGEYSVTFTGLEKGKTINKTYIVSPAFDGKNYEKALAIYEEKFKQFEEKKREIEELKEADKYKNKYISDEELSYVYQIKNMCWTNIDSRVFYIPGNRIELLVNIENKTPDEFVYVSLLMKSMNLYIPGYQKKDGTYGFSHYDAEPTNLPIGEEAIILATSYKKGIPYFAFQKITIAEKQEIKLNLIETTKDKLVAYLKENI